MIHLIGERGSRKVGAPLNHVPYKGVPPVVQDLLGKQIDLTFVPLGGSTADLVESGKVRVFGSSGATPSTRLPKVPAPSTLDPALADFVHTSWAAVFVPRSTTEAAALRLQRADAAGRQKCIAAAGRCSPPRSAATLFGLCPWISTCDGALSALGRPQSTAKKATKHALAHVAFTTSLSAWRSAQAASSRASPNTARRVPGGGPDHRRGRLVRRFHRSSRP